MATALAKFTMDDMRTYMQKDNVRQSIAAVLPKHMTTEKVIKIAQVAVSRQPELFECTLGSIATAVVTASQLGLEPDGTLGQAYLVAFKNGENKTREAKLIIGYRGLIELARRSGNIANIEAHVVHSRDEFEYEFGLEPKLRHKPCLNNLDGPGEIVAVYAIARFKDGGYQTEVMSLNEINSIKSRSKAASGPWITDFEEMAKKTVIKRLCKLLPLSPEMGYAVHNDNKVESGEAADIFNIETGEVAEMPEANQHGEVVEAELKKDKADEIAEKLGAA